MKITKQQLKRIIKEEKTKILREGITEEEALNIAIRDYVNALIDQMLDAGVDAGDYKADVYNFIDGYFENQAQTAEYDEADQYHIAQMQSAEKHDNPWDSTQNEGTSLEQMPSAWRQILGTCLKGKK